MKPSLTKSRPLSTMPADETGAPTDETPNARSSSSVPPKDITLGSSEQGSNVSSATGLSPVGQASMATDLNTSGVSVPTTTGPTAQETKVAATVTAKTGTKGVSAATDVHAPVSKGAPKAPNAPSALDMSFRADVTSTEAPSAHGRSRKKGRRSSSKSSSSSGSSKTSRQGATEGERKVKDAPSRSKTGRNAPRDKTSLEKGAFASSGATGSTAATTSILTPSKAPSVSGSLPSAAHPVAVSKATLQEAAADVGLPSDQRTPGKTIGGVFTGNYDDSISKITSTKVKGTKATKAFAEADRKTANVSACDQLRASLRSESAPVPETALVSDREADAAAPADGKAPKFAVVAETPANEGAGSHHLRGNVPSTTTGTLSSSGHEKPASVTAARVGSASAAGLGGHQAPEAPLREKVSDGAAAAASVGFPPTASKVGGAQETVPANQAPPEAFPEKAVAERESVQPQAALPGQQGTSLPASAGQEQAGTSSWIKRRQSGSKTTDETGVSDVHAGSTHGALKSTIGSPGQWWSFYPLNVTFVTEKDTGQECLVYGSMICISAIMFSVLVAILITAFFPNRALTPLSCMTPECVAARGYLASLINVSRDACADFYGYVCDSWIAHRKDGGSFRGDSVMMSLVSINESLWRKNDAEGDSSELRLMRRVYQGCHLHLSKRPSKATFRATLESARKMLNWAPIRECRDYHVLVRLLVRTSLLVGFHTVLVTELLSENNRTVIRFSCGRSLLHKLSDVGRRIDLHAALKTVVRDEAKDIPKIMEVEELVGHRLDGPECLPSVREKDVVGPLSKFVGGIVPGESASAWAEAVEEVLVASGENASQLADFAVASGAAGFRRAFADVVSAGDVDVSALYLATHLDLEIAYLELSRVELHWDSEGIVRSCVALSRRPLTLSWPSLLARILRVRESHGVLRSMFDQIKTTSPGTTVFAWMPKVMRRAAEEKIRDVNLAVVSEDMSPKYARTANATDPYESLISEWDGRDSSFVMLFVKTMSIAHGMRVRSRPTLAQVVVSQLEERHQVAYSSTTSSMIIPTLYQRPPHLYAMGVPSHFNYATVGAVLATRIVDIVVPALTSTGQAGAPQHADVWWARAARRHYNTSALCLQRLHGRLGLRYRAIGVNSGERQRRDMFLRAQGLRLAYDALVASLGPLTSNRHLRGLWHEAQAVFFARFCMLSCDADQRLRTTLSPRAKCLLPLHNMREFGAVFDCVSREDFVTEQCVA